MNSYGRSVCYTNIQYSFIMKWKKITKIGLIVLAVLLLLFWLFEGIHLEETTDPAVMPEVIEQDNIPVD